jgi:hypothetical protein
MGKLKKAKKGEFAKTTATPTHNAFRTLIIGHGGLIILGASERRLG